MADIATPTPFEPELWTTFVHPVLLGMEDLHREDLEYLQSSKVLKSHTVKARVRNDTLPRYACQFFGTEEGISGYASGIVPEGVFDRAYAEFVERYVSYKKRKGEPAPINLEMVMRIRRFRSLFGFSTPVITCSDVASRLPSQLPHAQTIPDTAFVHAYDLSSGKRAYIAERAVFWFREKGGSKDYFPSTTSGCGAGRTRMEARVSAMAELLERDQFLVGWLTKKGFRKMDANTIPETYLAHTLIDSLTERGIGVHLFDMRRDTAFPAFLCVLVDARGEPALAVGASVKQDPDKAIYAATDEALCVLEYMLTDERTTTYDPSSYPFSSSTIGRNARLRLWKGDMMQHADWLLSLPETTYSASEYEHLTSLSLRAYHDALISELHVLSKYSGAKHPGVYAYDFSNDVIARAGLCVSRVIVPGAVPLYLDEDTASLSHKRIALALGLSSEHDMDVRMLNSDPHPFP